MRFVHSSVQPGLAARFGAHSLRELLLLQEKLTDTFTLPDSRSLSRALGGDGVGGEPGMHVLLDLLEVADLLDARAVHFCLDRRVHGTQSLVSPSLAPFQGEALCCFMPAVRLSAEQLCLLHGQSSTQLHGRAPTRWHSPATPPRGRQRTRPAD